MTGNTNWNTLRTMGNPAPNYSSDLLSGIFSQEGSGIAAPSIAASIQQGSLPMLNSIGPAPGLFEGIGADITNWWNKTPLATTTDAKGMKTQGMFDMGLGTAQGLLGAYLGFQNLGIAKDTLAQNKRQFDLNFGAQQKMTNSRLADRQATRIASGLNAAPVSEYMAKYGI